ncbi:ferritin [Candidatus Omnitrophota bacterium]
MDKKLVKAFNEQIKNELYSAYLYLSMAAYCDSINLPGCAHWMKLQAGEEEGHAMKMFDFLSDRGDRVKLQAIPQPPEEFSSAKGVFEETLKHEKKVTALINKLYELANDVEDNAASIFLQWFVTEQVEEEKNASDILAQLKVVKADAPSMLMLDNVLAKRAAEKE